MATTGKRRRSDDANEEELEEEDRLSTSSMTVEEESRKMTKREEDPPPFFEMIPGEIIPHVLSYLDNAKELFRLSGMCQAFRKHVTPELVVKTAVFQGGKTKKVIQNLMKGIQSKSLRVPSTLRMLRLVNSEVCERGKDCCGYNLEKEKPSFLHKPTHRPFGLSICSDCLPVVSASIGCKSRLKDVSERVERYDDLKLAFETHFDNITGEECGPLVLYKNVTQIQNTVWEDEKRKAMFDDLFEQLDSTISEEDKVRSEAYIAAFNSAMEESDAHQLRKNNILRDNAKAKWDKRVARKKELSGPVFDKLERLLENFNHKDTAMSGHWNDSGFYSFEFWPSKLALEPLLSAPSSATKKKMKEAVALVHRIYSTLESMGLIGEPHHLSHRLEALNLQEDLLNHERALLHLFMYERPVSSFLCLYNEKKYTHLWNSLQSGRLSEALFWSLKSYEDKMNAFVYSVATDDKTERLAQTIWKRRNTSWRWQRNRDYFPDTFNRYRETYNASKIDFDRIVPLIKEYMEHPATVAWLARTTPPTNEGQTFSRMNAVDTLLDWRNIIYLEEGRFDTLLSIHSRMFDNPRLYGVDPNP